MIAEAVRWYRLAARQGNAAGQSNLGFMNAEGRGLAKNYVEALRLYRLAAGQGFAQAQTNLGAMYVDGRGVPKNDAEAAEWFRLAANQGFASAQARLGVLYEKESGPGEALDPERFPLVSYVGGSRRSFGTTLPWVINSPMVRAWRMTMSRPLNGTASPPTRATSPLKQISECCMSTVCGVAQNYNEAARWYRVAADRGLASAQVDLGSLYFDGRGVVQSDVEALKWLRLAAEQELQWRSRTLGSCTKWAEARSKATLKRLDGQA